MAENGVEPPAKKAKNDDKDLTDLSGFQFERVLNESAEDKRIIVQGRIVGKSDDDAHAIVVIEKLPFGAERVKDLLNENLTMKQQFRNGIYSMYHGHTAIEKANELKVNVVWPATQKHIDKFASSPGHVINETPALYNFVTLPFLETQSFDIDWVFDILNHKTETERIVYEDYDPETGFILIPDLKWSRKHMEDLYCLAIIHKKGIKSIRDLTKDHLPLLRKLYHDAPAAIESKFGLHHSKLRIYFHYQPTYYHLHVHYTNIDFKAPGTNAEKGQMLKTVISNIEKGNSYGRATIPFHIKEGTKLYKAYVESGYEFEKKVASKDDDEEVGKTLEFLRLLGKAKHEPCGEHWSSSFGDGAWRMAVMSICLSTSLNRKHLVEVALCSALTGLGKETDQNSTWPDKLKEVRTILDALLPLRLAAKLYDLYVIHVSARRGLPPKTEEERVYRKLLEMEEALLMWEEFQLENDEAAARKLLLSKMVEAGFPGHEKYTMFGDSADFQSLLTFFITISNLRRLKRTGWVRSGVRDPERVSGHMFRMGMMSLMLETEQNEANNKILGGTSMIVSIIHDLAECIVGDFTPSDPITPEEKHQKEMDAIKSLVQDLPCSTHSKEIFDAFERYENQADDDFEAQLTKDLDKFDMVLQAFEYEMKKPSDKSADFLQDFFDSTKGFFKQTKVQRWDKFLRSVRQDHLKSS